MRKYSSILAVMLLSLYSVTFAHSVFAHEHEEAVAMEVHSDSHGHHSHDSGHSHSHHKHSHQDKKPAKHTLWGLLDHIFAAHSNTSADLHSIYFSEKGQEVFKVADFQCEVAGKVSHTFHFLLVENNLGIKLTTYRNSHYTFLRYHSITLRGPPSLV